MSKPKSYVRPDDGATMFEVEPHQYVSAKILQRKAAILAPWNTMNRTRPRRRKAQDGVRGGRRARQVRRGGK
jgi:hypothetical protein